jgi:nucleotide-binding universal stress UspA family protein
MTEETSPFVVGAGGHDEVRRPVVAGVDGSDHAERAAAWAADEAERRGTTLTLVHALHLPESGSAPVGPIDYADQCRADGRKLLDEQAAAVRTRHPGLEVATELSDRDAARTLTSLSESAALIVTGSRGRGGFAGMLLGSVSRKLAVHTRGPLVVVRIGTPGDTANRIVLGVGRKHSDAAVRYAFEAARRQGAVLHVVRAFFANMLYTGMAGPGTMYEGHPDSDRIYAATRTQDAIAPFITEYPDVTVDVSTVEGNAVSALIDAARQARLLVVATHRHRGPLPVGAGYVVDGVLAHSPAPVAVIPER